MRRLFLAQLTAVVALCLLAGAAEARTGLSFSPTNYTAFIHNMEFSGGFGVVRCDVTMTVTKHASVAKRSGELAGFITLAFSTNACSEGNMGLFEARGARVTGLQGPYHYRYESFGGELPSIREVSLGFVGVRFWIQEPVFRAQCETTEAITATTTGGNPATGISINRAGIRLEGTCGFTSMSMRGSGSLYRELAHTTLQSMTITLV